MDDNLKYSAEQVVKLSMHNIGERSLKIISQNGIQADYLESLSTAKSENAVKQIEWQKLNQEFQYGTHNF